MIIEISVAVVAIAFAALVVFLIQTLRSVSDLLGQTNMVIRELQEQMNGISTEAVELLRHTNEVSVDVRNKLHSIDSVVDSVKNIGDASRKLLLRSSKRPPRWRERFGTAYRKIRRRQGKRLNMCCRRCRW